MSALVTPARPRAARPIGQRSDATPWAVPPAPVSGAPIGSGNVDVVTAEELRMAIVVAVLDSVVVPGAVVVVPPASVVVVPPASVVVVVVPGATLQVGTLIVLV